MSKVFTAKQNPLDKNKVCIYEKKVSKEDLMFMVDKRDYEDDREFNEAVEFIVESLNKNVNND